MCSVCAYLAMFTESMRMLVEGKGKGVRGGKRQYTI